MAMLLLVIHGLAGVIWIPASQVLIHQIVAPEQLPSAVRINATGRYLGFLVGPALGGALLLGLGPAYGIFVNALIYAPLFVWLISAALWIRRQRLAAAPAGHRRFRRRLVDHAGGGAQSNSAVHDRPDRCGVASSSAMPTRRKCPNLRAISATGGRISRIGCCSRPMPPAGWSGGLILETRGLLKPRARTAFLLAMIWCCALVGFARTESLRAGDRAAVLRWIRRTRVQFDGAVTGANECTGRDPRPRDRRVLDVGDGTADFQRADRRPARAQASAFTIHCAERRGVVGSRMPRCSRCATGGVPEP